VRKIMCVLSIILALISLGCSARSVMTSVPTRVFREVHGLRVRSYQITPVTDDLRLYRAIEVHQLENLMLDQIPESSVKQLNMEIVKGLRSQKHFDRISEAYELPELQGGSITQSHPNVRADRSQSILILEGYIDDYTPGIPKLRYIEQGNNHAVLTVRIILKDKQTARVLGEVNITVENTRVTSNVSRMVEKTAEEVSTFVDRSTTQYKSPKEVTPYVQ
jgi:hypothetical protein